MVTRVRRVRDAANARAVLSRVLSPNLARPGNVGRDSYGSMSLAHACPNDPWSDRRQQRPHVRESAFRGLERITPRLAASTRAASRRGGQRRSVAVVDVSEDDLRLAQRPPLRCVDFQLMSCRLPRLNLDCSLTTEPLSARGAARARVGAPVERLPAARAVLYGNARKCEQGRVSATCFRNWAAFFIRNFARPLAPPGLKRRTPLSPVVEDAAPGEVPGAPPRGQARDRRETRPRRGSRRRRCRCRCACPTLLRRNRSGRPVCR